MSTRRETVVAVSVIALFFVVRFALLVVREPFFDELFTVWMAGKPFAEIVPALTLDSGPPLYYFIARIPNVFALRVLSLAFATGTLALILMRRSLGTGRWIAATLLALYPPAALFAVDARAYALCGLFVALGAVSVHERRPFPAAAAFLLAAYTHWYGALFLPLIVMADPPSLRSGGRFGRLRISTAGENSGRSGRRSTGIVATVVAAILFIPGLWLASMQPAAATGWLSDQPRFAVLSAFAFAGNYAESLFRPAPLFVIALSAIAVLVAGTRTWTFAPMVLVPVILAIAIALAGRTVYFPMRFESVLAAPLVLWLARSLQWWRRELRWLFVSVLCVCGAITIVRGASDHQQRPLDPYREAAMVVARTNDIPVVASGFLYLETVHQLGASRVRAFPAEQGSHPGWRVSGATSEPLPRGPFVWIGERAAPELANIRQRDGDVVFANKRAMIVRVR